MDRSLIAVSMMGAHWVLQLLIVLSIFSLAIMIERIVFYLRHRVDAGEMAGRLSRLLDDGNIKSAYALYSTVDSMETQVLAEGLHGLASGASIQELMDSETTRQRTRFEKRLMFLGTLGNNAPFIGLFGTVLGIIKAFHDLSLNDPSRAGTGAQAVMAGVSEALVATAVGLAVALPAVVAFNYFKSIVKGAVANTESLSKILAAHAERLR
ncbi:MAG: MotA/TolQ/ExbB proton channel family protein, partial [Polyangia bacterium]